MPHLLNTRPDALKLNRSSPSAEDGYGHADWAHLCCGRSGSDVIFLGENNTSILVAGQAEQGDGVVAWWDTSAPAASMCVQSLRMRRHLPTGVALVSSVSHNALAVSDDSGGVSAYDLRMMGEGRLVWRLPRLHASGVTSLVSWASGDSFDAFGQQSKRSGWLVSGGRDGDVCVVDGLNGVLVDRIEKAHYNLKRGALAGLLHPAQGMPRATGMWRVPPGATPASVSGLAFCPDGLLSCGGDGVVRFHAFRQPSRRSSLSSP